MIYVDPLRPTGAPWRGRIACRMASDRGLEELVSFAASIGLQLHWVHRGAHPYFELSPGIRRRALEAGAVAVGLPRFEALAARGADAGTAGGPCGQPGRG